MSIVAGSILLYLPDDEAYYLLVSIILKNRLDAMYRDISNLDIKYYILRELLQLYLPKVSTKLKEFKIQEIFYGPVWFLTLFS